MPEVPQNNFNCRSSLFVLTIVTFSQYIVCLCYAAVEEATKDII